MKKRTFLLVIALTLLLAVGVFFGLRLLIPAVHNDTNRLGSRTEWAAKLYWHELEMPHNAELTLGWEPEKEETIRQMAMTRTLDEQEQIDAVLALLNEGAGANKKETDLGVLRMRIKTAHSARFTVRLYENDGAYFLRRFEEGSITDWAFSRKNAQTLLALIDTLTFELDDTTQWARVSITRLAQGEPLWTASLPVQQYEALAEALRAVLDKPSERSASDFARGEGQWCINLQLNDGLFLRLEYAARDDGSFTLLAQKLDSHVQGLNHYEDWTGEKAFLFEMQDPFAALLPDFEGLVEEVLQ